MVNGQSHLACTIRRINRFLSCPATVLLCVSLQSACGGGNGQVSLTMSIDPTTITLGESATISWEWKTPDRGYCQASGAWHGDRKWRNSQVVTPTETGTLTYTLECIEGISSPTTRTRTASVTLTVNPPAAVTLASLAQSTTVAYAYTTIDFPGADRTEAFGINEAGQIVGHFFDATGQHGFLKDGDNYVAFDVGLDGTSALGINDVPQIVGFASDQGFLKDGNLIVPIAVAESNFTVAWGINSAGSVVGTFNDDFGTHGFLKDGDDILPIDGLNASFTEATGINDSGEIVGNYVRAGQFQAFKLSGGTLSVIQAPAAITTEAHDINQHGQIVGTFVDPNSVVHGFVMSDSGISIIDAPGAASPNFTQAKGINDAGMVVGWFDEGGGRVHGFLAVPVDITQVAIDVAPGNKENTISARSTGGIWVAILSTTDSAHAFDPVSQVDTSTVVFGPDGANPVRNRAQDINKDGLPDLLLQFKLAATGLHCGETQAALTGSTFDGRPFRGTDSITAVGCS